MLKNAQLLTDRRSFGHHLPKLFALLSVIGLTACLFDGKDNKPDMIAPAKADSSGPVFKPVAGNQFKYIATIKRNDFGSYDLNTDTFTVRVLEVSDSSRSLAWEVRLQGLLQHVHQFGPGDTANTESDSAYAYLDTVHSSIKRGNENGWIIDNAAPGLANLANGTSTLNFFVNQIFLVDSSSTSDPGQPSYTIEKDGDSSHPIPLTSLIWDYYLPDSRVLAYGSLVDPHGPGIEYSIKLLMLNNDPVRILSDGIPVE